MQQLVTYILTAMLTWIPVRNLTPYGETEAEATARLRSVAEDICMVALDANEPPVFGRADGRVKTALLDAAVASMETGFQKFVDDGSCNRRGYRADRRGDCDGGHAFTFWQLHVAGNGYILLEDGTLGSVFYSPAAIVKSAQDKGTVIRGPELLADRKTAIRVAQRIMRDSLKQHNSLCAYSGESCDEGAHPKASVRFERARTYLAQHPFTDAIPDPVVLSANTVTMTAVHD
jgi:hypothetical protein